MSLLEWGGLDKNKRLSFHSDARKIRLRLNGNLAANIRDWSDQVTGGHIAILSGIVPLAQMMIHHRGSRVSPTARIIRVLASAQSWGLAILCFLAVCCHCIQVWYIWWCFWSVSLHGDDDMSSSTVTNASLGPPTSQTIILMSLKINPIFEGFFVGLLLNFLTVGIIFRFQ